MSLDWKQIKRTPLLDKPQISFRSYGTASTSVDLNLLRLQLTGNDRNLLNNHSFRMQRCNQVKGKLEKAIEKNTALIEAVSQAVEKPTIINGQFTSVYGGRADC